MRGAIVEIFHITGIDGGTLYGDKYIVHPLGELKIDPAEWSWKQQDLPPTTILNYTTKRGYRINCRRDATPLNGEATLRSTKFFD